MINTSDKRYPEYVKECEALKEEAKIRLSKVKSPKNTLDGEELLVCKELNKKIDKLKKKYSFLFEEE